MYKRVFRENLIIPANSHALGVLRVENCDLTLAHACGPISHAWLKNVSCCRLAWHNFQKYVNSDPCKERKPCVKMVKWQYLPRDLWLWSEKHWERARVYMHPKTGSGITLITSPSADFRCLWKTSGVFGGLWTSSGIFGNDRVIFKKSQHSQDKNLPLICQKKLAGISYVCYSFYISYFHVCWSVVSHGCVLILSCTI